MTADPVSVHPDPLDLVACAMGTVEVRHIPVVSAEGRLVGILTERDFLSYVLSFALD